MKKIVRAFILLGVLGSTFSSFAHHVLGRPAYSLNEDSNTPPSMQIETRIGDFFVTYMVYPAFPKPGVAGRINLYAIHIETNEPFEGNVSFEIKDDSWFASPSEIIGTQLIDDSVYRQGFVVNKRGDYIITAKFKSNGEPYIIDFPLRIGVPSQFTLPVIIIGSIFGILILVSLVQRKRLMQMRIKDSKE